LDNSTGRNAIPDLTSWSFETADMITGLFIHRLSAAAGYIIEDPTSQSVYAHYVEEIA